MKRRMKSVLSLVLALVTLLAVSSPAFSASAAYANDLPIVYVAGKNTYIYDTSGKRIYPTTGLEDMIMGKSTALSVAFASSFASGNWKGYSDVIYNMVMEQYKDFVPNENGEVTNGTAIKPVAEPKKKTSNFGLNDYVFTYDSRLDPYVNASYLNTYIKKVLTATGKSKVQLIGRCLGCTLIATYLAVYGSSKIDTAIFYASSAQGVIPLSCFFSGDIEFDSEALHRYATTEMNDDFSDFVKAMIKLSYQTSIFPMGAESVASIYSKVAETLYPRLVLAVYGTCPGFWTMVNDEKYEKAKSVVFAGETKKYSKLISKIDKYHTNVFNKLPSILEKCRKNGMKLAIITKYNIAMPPLFENCLKQADNLVELESASFGAYTANIGKTFSSAYIRYLENSGKDEYLSPDLTVDASSCLFPDYTWFVKDLAHETLPTSVDSLIMNIFHSKSQYTVTTNKSFPQFMQYNSSDGSLSAVEGPETPSSEKKPSAFFSALISIFAKVFGILFAIIGIGGN